VYLVKSESLNRDGGDVHPGAVFVAFELTGKLLVKLGHWFLKSLLPISAPDQKRDPVMLSFLIVLGAQRHFEGESGILLIWRRLRNRFWFK